MKPAVGSKRSPRSQKSLVWPTLILQARGLELRLRVRLHVVVRERGDEGERGAENTVDRMSALQHLTTGWSGIIKEYAKIVSWE